MAVTNPRTHAVQHTRRWLLAHLLTIGGALLASIALPIRLAWSEVKHGNLQSSLGTPDPVFMRHAQKMKDLAVEAGDQPYGAVVVKNGHVVGEGPSRVVTCQDPTAHAEMEAIRDAARCLGTRDLSGCVLYATSRPCLMCQTASYWANLSRIYSGASMSDGGAPQYRACEPTALPAT